MNPAIDEALTSNQHYLDFNQLRLYLFNPVIDQALTSDQP